MNAIVIGGTGATGRQLIKQLLNSNKWIKVTSIGRRPVLNGKKHEKLVDIVVDSMHELHSTASEWGGHNSFFNCIGTTRGLAGSADNFVRIEKEISSDAAALASRAEIPHASLISANGANHKQWSLNWIHPLLYIKTMGMKEQTLIENNFKNISIFRPGLLIRKIQNLSIPEKVLVKVGKGLSVNLLAAAMILDAEQNFDSKNKINYYQGNSRIKELV